MPKVPILMPQLGDSIAEATVLRLRAAQGDTVEADPVSYTHLPQPDEGGKGQKFPLAIADMQVLNVVSVQAAFSVRLHLSLIHI